MNTNIFARIAHVANVNCIAENNFCAKEQPTMNAFKSIVTRAAKTLGVIALLSLSHAAVKADVVVDNFVGPQAVYNQPPANTVNPGTTALQLKVRNTDTHYGVTGVTVQTYIYLDSDVNNGWLVRAQPRSSVFSLAAGQSEWITIDIPNTDLQGQSLRGQRLYAKALVSSHTYWLTDFLDSAFYIDLMEVGKTMHPDGSVTVAVQFTNNGHIASLPQTVTFRYMPWAEGNLWTAPGVATASLPALQPGQSAIVHFTTTSLSNISYDYVKAIAQIGTDESLSFQF